MAVLPRFLEGAAFGVLNDILSGFRTNEGFARPNHYEVIIYKRIFPFKTTNNDHFIFNNFMRSCIQIWNR